MPICLELRFLKTPQRQWLIWIFTGVIDRGREMTMCDMIIFGEENTCLQKKLNTIHILIGKASIQVFSIRKIGCSFLLLRGTIINRTYGSHKNLYIPLFLLTIFGPINYGPP